MSTSLVPVVANADGSVTLNVPNNADYQFGPATIAVNGTPLNLTGGSAQLQVRRTAGDPNKLIDFGTTPNTTLTLGGAAGTVTATATRAVMEALYPGDYAWDLVITLAGAATRWLGGVFSVYRGVSR